MRNRESSPERTYRAEPVSSEILAAASDMANKTCAMLADSEGLVQLSVERLSVRLLSTESATEFWGDQMHDEVAEVGWVSWCHSGNFEANLLAGLSANSERVNLTVEVLLSGEAVGYGLGPEYNFLEAETNIMENAGEPSAEVLNALAQKLKELWADDLVEWAEEDSDFILDWPPALRTVAEQILNEHSNRPDPPQPTCPYCGSPTRKTLLFSICTDPSCKKKSQRR